MNLKKLVNNDFEDMIFRKIITFDEKNIHDSKIKTEKNLMCKKNQNIQSEKSWWQLRNSVSWSLTKWWRGKRHYNQKFNVNTCYKIDLWSFIETFFFQYNLGYTKTAYGIDCRYTRDKPVTIKKKPMKFN